MQLRSSPDQAVLPVAHAEAGAMDTLVADMAVPRLQEQSHNSTYGDLGLASARILVLRISITCDTTETADSP